MSSVVLIGEVVVVVCSVVVVGVVVVVLVVGVVVLVVRVVVVVWAGCCFGLKNCRRFSCLIAGALILL